MKTVLSIFLVSLILMSFTSCGDTSDEKQDDNQVT